MKSKIFASFERRSKNIKWVFPLSLLLFGIGACEPDGPSDHQQFYEMNLLKKDNTPTAKEADPVPDCKTPGTGCMVPIRPVHPYYTRQQLYSELLSDYANNSMSSFFSRPDWQDMFPGVQPSSDEYQRLMTGEYQLHFTADSTIVVYKNQHYSAENMLYAFQWK